MAQSSLCGLLKYISDYNKISCAETVNVYVSPILTLSIGELLSESVGCDDKHPLDPPEQYHVIAFQLEKI